MRWPGIKQIWQCLICGGRLEDVPISDSAAAGFRLTTTCARLVPCVVTHRLLIDMRCLVTTTPVNLSSASRKARSNLNVSNDDACCRARMIISEYAKTKTPQSKPLGCWPHGSTCGHPRMLDVARSPCRIEMVALERRPAGTNRNQQCPMAATVSLVARPIAHGNQ